MAAPAKESYSPFPPARVRAILERSTNPGGLRGLFRGASLFVGKFRDTDQGFSGALRASSRARELTGEFAGPVLSFEFECLPKGEGSLLRLHIPESPPIRQAVIFLCSTTAFILLLLIITSIPFDPTEPAMLEWGLQAGGIVMCGGIIAWYEWLFRHSSRRVMDYFDDLLLLSETGA
ncbi:MAG: hypothetical protein KDB82_00200 [Planctomycetes bacterium]|nr:hypothetical protein [Planctomycetota bacterium]